LISGCTVNAAKTFLMNPGCVSGVFMKVFEARHEKLSLI